MRKEIASPLECFGTAQSRLRFKAVNFKQLRRAFNGIGVIVDNENPKLVNIVASWPCVPS